MVSKRLVVSGWLLHIQWRAVSGQWVDSASSLSGQCWSEDGQWWSVSGHLWSGGGLCVITEWSVGGQWVVSGRQCMHGHWALSVGQ